MEKPKSRRVVMCVWCGVTIYRYEDQPPDADESVRLCRTHDEQCDKNPLRAEVEKLRGVLDGIEIYASDTLSGAATNPRDPIQWLREGIRVIRDRARAALSDPKHSNAGENETKHLAPSKKCQRCGHTVVYSMESECLKCGGELLRAPQSEEVE